MKKNISLSVIFFTYFHNAGSLLFLFSNFGEFGGINNTAKPWLVANGI